MPGKGDINPATGKAYAVNPSSGVWDDNYWESFKKTLPGYAQQQAQEQAQKLSAQQAADTAAQNALQEKKQSDFITKFQSAIGGQESLTDASSRIGGTLGLPGLRDTAQGLIKSVSQIPQVQSTATRGFNVNSNQLSQIIASKQAQLAPQAQQAVTQQQAAEGQLGQQLGYLQADQTKQLQPLQMEGSMLSDQIAREMTGFNQDKQSQLSVYLQNLQNGQQLTMQELNNANALALAKIQYDNTKSAVANQVVSAGSSLYSPTGQLLATAPQALKATAGSSNNPASI